MNPKYNGGIDLDNISEELQGHRSKLKVNILKKKIIIIILFNGVNHADSLCCFM